MNAIIPATLMFVAATSAALAQGRPATPRMSCQSAASLVQRTGAIVLATGGQTYDRFVSSQSYCPTGLTARAAFVPTADNPQCYIGYYCSTASPRFRD